MKTIALLDRIKDPRSNKGKNYSLKSLLGLVLLGLLCGRRGLMACHRLGRSLTARQKIMLGFRNGNTPAHSTIFEVIRKIDSTSLVAAFQGLAVESNDIHLALDGKTMRGSSDEAGKNLHVLSAFSKKLYGVYGLQASRGLGYEIQDAFQLLTEIDLSGLMVTGDAIFCQKKITDLIVNKGGDYLLTVKDNQSELKSSIALAFAQPIIKANCFDSGFDKQHGRIERRIIEILPASCANISETWPNVKTICKVTRFRQIQSRQGWRQETKEVRYLICSKENETPENLLRFNREHWAIEIWHRKKDVLLKEDFQTTWKDNSPLNLFALNNLALALLKQIHQSPIRATEWAQKFMGKTIKAIVGA